MALIKEKKDTDEEGSSDEEESSSEESSASSGNLQIKETKQLNFSNDRARTSKVTFAPQAELANNGMSKLIGLNFGKRSSSVG